MNANAEPIRLPSISPLNLPLGVVLRADRDMNVKARVVAEDIGMMQALQELRIEVLALREVVEVGLDLLSHGAEPREIADFLTTSGRFNPKARCRCSLHNRAA